MTSQDKDEGQGVVWAVLVSVVLLAISLATGVGLWRTAKPAASAVPQVAASAMPAADAVAGAPAGADQAGADGASVRVEDEVVKFYFASGKADLAEGAPEALAGIVRGVAAGRTAVISGFHDTTGNPAFNAELAKQRALAVRNALTALGIGEDKLELKKPEVAALADGSNAEARRVEVRLQ